MSYTTKDYKVFNYKIKDTKLPYKIYVRPQAFETPWPPYIDENANYGGEQYIRKEALLEWKEELEEHVRKCAGGIVGQYEHGYWKALDDLIDKLNEM